MGGDLKKKIGFEENNYCSVRKKTSKYVTVTPDADEERINVPCMQTCSWKEKLSVLMLPRFQGSLQRTKT